MHNQYKCFNGFRLFLIIVLFIITHSELLAQSSGALKRHQKAIAKSAAKGNVVISMDTVFYKGKAMFLCIKDANLNYVRYFQSFDGNGWAKITKYNSMDYGITRPFVIEINKMSNKASITTGSFASLAKIMIEQGVHQNGSLNMSSAQAFINKYRYVPSATANSKYSSTTVSKSSTTQSTNSRFTLKNNCSKSVRVFIGTKPKYGSGTSFWLSANSSENKSASVHHQVCIVDKSDNGISCTKVPSNGSTLFINKNGTGFE